MAGRSHAAAVEALVRPLQQSLSCVTAAVLVQGYDGSGRPHAASFDGRYVPLQGRYRLELSVLHQYELVERRPETIRWAAHTVGYWYQVRQLRGPEVIAYHWHPVGRSQVAFPHLHVGGSTAPIDIGGRRHVPTGRVALEAVVRFLLTELDVRPLRPDWEAVLAANEAGFDEARTW